MKNGDMPAMPVVIPVGVVTQPGLGLTKREMIAMHIMQGFAADTDFSAPGGKVAELAVLWADTLLAELERTKSS